MMSLSLLLLVTLDYINFGEALVFGRNADSLVGKANIYYQIPVNSDEHSELILDEVEQLPSKTNVKVIIHGYTGNRFHCSIASLRNAYMSKGMENVLLADWADAANLDYSSSRKVIGKVATHFGNLLQNFFDKHEIAPIDVHIIGHSLGAHMAGGIGDYFNGSLGRVTGLDPALPLFTPLSSDSLHASAAQFVDVIHTDFPVFGDATPRGTVDFYPNFGVTPQPGCADMDVLLVAKQLIFEQYSCSHNRAVLLYAESIGQPKNFPALSCSLNGIKMINTNDCWRKPKVSAADGTVANEAVTQMDEGRLVYMGEEVSRRATGLYYLPTYDSSPYGMGANTRF